jgi:hypothetical protein
MGDIFGSIEVAERERLKAERGFIYAFVNPSHYPQDTYAVLYIVLFLCTVLFQCIVLFDLLTSEVTGRSRVLSTGRMALPRNSICEVLLTERDFSTPLPAVNSVRHGKGKG